MSDPKYNKYAGTVRFDDDNIVDIELQPDTENITVKLNGSEVTGGSGLPEVDSSDNGDVLTVVSGEWTNAAPASGGSDVMIITITLDRTTDPFTVSFDKTAAQVNAHLEADDNNIIKFKYTDSNGVTHYYDVSTMTDYDEYLYISLSSVEPYGTSMNVYMGGVTLSSDTIAWDATLDDTTTGSYPGGSREITYSIT